MRKTIFTDFWPKFIALILAIATWFYVFDLTNSETFMQKKDSKKDIFELYNFIAKDVPVKPVYFGKSPKGYRVLFDKVKIVPESITIFGPEEAISGINEMQTDNINLAEYTRSIQLRKGLQSDIEGLKIDDKIVDISLPVEEINEDSVKKTKTTEEIKK